MNQVITPTNESALDKLRHETVREIMRGYGATKVYAEGLTQYLGDGWYTFEHNDKTEAAKPTLAEGQKFRDELRKAGHTNPSVAWTRVRNEGRKLVEGEATKGEGDGEGEGDKAGAKEVRSLKLRMIEELSTLHKAAKREENRNNLGKAEAEAATHIAAALKALGVDLTMVK